MEAGGVRAKEPLEHGESEFSVQHSSDQGSRECLHPLSLPGQRPAPQAEPGFFEFRGDRGGAGAGCWGVPLSPQPLAFPLSSQLQWAPRRPCHPLPAHLPRPTLTDTVLGHCTHRHVLTLACMQTFLHTCNQGTNMHMREYMSAITHICYTQTHTYMTHLYRCMHICAFYIS